MYSDEKKSLAERAIDGLVWRVAVVACGIGTHFVAIAVLARLLTPREVGDFQAAMMYVEPVVALTHSGLVAAAVQARDLGEQRVVSVATAALLASSVGVLLLAGLSLLLEGPAATLLAPLSLLILLKGCGLPSEAALNRRLLFRSVAKTEIASAVTYLCIAILLAVNGAGAWSLASATIVSSAVATVGLLRVTSFPFSSRPSIAGVGELVRFGFWLSLSRVASAFARAGPGWSVQQRLGAAPLAFYDRAYRLARIPSDILVSVAGNVVFSSVAHVQGDSEREQRGFLIGLSAFGFVSFPVAGLIGLLAPEIVLFVLGSQWIEAIRPLQVLSVLTALNPVAKFADDVLRGLGHSRVHAVVYSAYAAVTVGATFVVAEDGLLPVAVVAVTSNAARAAVLTEVARRAVGVSAWSVADTLSLPIMATACGLCAGALSRELVAPSGAVVSLLLGSAGWCVGVLVCSFAMPGPAAAQLRDAILGALRLKLMAIRKRRVGL